MPDGLNDRAADNWRPLLSIADVAGGDWPELARTAVKLLAGGDDDHEEARVKLLADIRDIFTGRNVDRMASADIVSALVDMEDRPWPEWKNGKPLAQNQLARLLLPFKIKPENIRVHGKIPKGYHWKASRMPLTAISPLFNPLHRYKPTTTRLTAKFKPLRKKIM